MNNILTSDERQEIAKAFLSNHGDEVSNMDIGSQLEFFVPNTQILCVIMKNTEKGPIVFIPENVKGK